MKIVCEYCEIPFEYKEDNMYRGARRGYQIPIYVDCPNCKESMVVGKQFAFAE